MVVIAKIHQLKSSLHKRYIMKMLTTCDLLEDSDSVLVIFISSLLSTVLGSQWMLHELHCFQQISFPVHLLITSRSVFLKCFWKPFLELGNIISFYLFEKLIENNEKHLPKSKLFSVIPSHHTILQEAVTASNWMPIFSAFLSSFRHFQLHLYIFSFLKM